MNLPFVIDVAVGLIFIFLILSLLASEIQELLTTLLQWRAKHLKNSIEILLAGGVGTQQEDDVRDVVQKLYDDPLIKNINQEAKGWWASRRRAVTRLSQSSFGKNQTTGPSYIAPETFATSLLERVCLADLSHTLVEVRLQAFAARIIGLDEAKPDDEPDSPEKRETETPADLDLLWEKGRVRQIAEKANQPDLNEDSNFQLLAEEFNDVLEDFKAGETSLVTAVERMEESFDAYINSYPILIENGESSQTQDSDLTHFVKRLKGFKLSTFGNKGERAIKSGGLRPSLLEIAELADKSSDTYREIANNYKRLIVEGKKLDEIVLPRLKNELLTTHIEVIESQLTVKHLAEIEDQLKVKHSGVIKAFEKKLKANSDKLTKHLAHFKPVSLRRHPRLAEELEIKSPSLDAKFGQALTCPIKPVSRRRSLFRLRSWFAHRRREGVFTLRQLKQLKQERQQIVTDILDRLPETDRQELVASILDKLSKPNSEELYGDIERGRFGLIDCVLDRLPDIERCFLANRVLTAFGEEEKWSEKFEKEQRSLYKNYQAYKTTQQILEKLPNATKESLVILARRAQTRVQRTGNDIDQFREEVAVWFDHSMSRASGVYKRNAKGVGILIGLLLVVATNVDVGFIVDRLSNDQSLRNVIAERAISITDKNMTLDKARADTNEALKELALPIGWNPSNVADQLNCSLSDKSLSDKSLPDKSLPAPLSGWPKFYQVCLGNQVEKPQASDNPVKAFLFSAKTWLRNLIVIVFKHPWALPRILLGWLIAGIAISMGAPFWFDLLGKVVNVRNTGGKPPSGETQSVAKPALAEIPVRREQ